MKLNINLMLNFEIYGKKIGSLIKLKTAVNCHFYSDTRIGNLTL